MPQDYDDAMYRYPARFLLLLFATGGLSAQAAEPVRILKDFDVRFDYKQVQKSETGRELITPDFQSLSPAPGTRFEQFDTRLLYPITGKGMRFDVGMNLRYIQGITRSRAEGVSGYTRLDRTIPAFHASARFDLPFRGLSAGFEGSHTAVTNQIQDYRAKLQYQWKSGLGLQGGWQHQQMSLETGDTATRFTSQGPYLDLNWNF